jgi:hypothetical protein
LTLGSREQAFVARFHSASINVEQPLAAVSAMKDLLDLYQRSPLPIFVDESCFITKQDLPKRTQKVGFFLSIYC